VADRAGEVRDTIFELVKNGPKGPEQLGEELYTQKLSRLHWPAAGARVWPM